MCHAASTASWRSAVVVGTVKPRVQGRRSGVGDRVAVRGERRDSFDQDIDPPVLHLEASVDHEQGMAAHLERSLHHRGPEHQVEMRLLVRQGEESETACR